MVNYDILLNNKRMRTYNEYDIDPEKLYQWAMLNDENSHWCLCLLQTIETTLSIRERGMNIESLTLKRIFPYGLYYEEPTCKVVIPKEYESLKNTRLAYNMMMTSLNRHFWYLLTLEEKIELYYFLKNNQEFKLKYMTDPYYNAGKLFGELISHQFVFDSISSDAIIIEDEQFIKLHKNMRWEPDDPIMQRSLEPWRRLTFENCTEKHIIFEEIDTRNRPRIHGGQYIENVQDPKGTVGY